MNPAQILSLAYLVGTAYGMLAGALCPWWLAGAPCYALAGAAHLAFRDPDWSPAERSAAVSGAMFGSCAAATVVSMICNLPHETGALEGFDPCAVPIIIALVYAAGVWHDEMNPPTWPATRMQVLAACCALYLTTCGLAWLLRSAT
jgi:hypothetical protein